MITPTIVKRNSNIELLRFVLMLGICVWHMMVHGMGIKNIQDADTYISMDTPVLVMLSVCVPSVNCFMLISGFYGINLDYKKIARFSIQGLIYLISVFLFLRFFNLGGGGNHT